MKSQWLWLVLGACVWLGAQGATAQTGRGMHKKIHAVPAPGTVVVDGTLDDWDLSGQIHSYVVAETAETMSARLAARGWQPQQGQTVKMDVGYLFGNAPGTQAAARAYWMNNGFSANVVNDVPNENRLEPAEWGTATVE
jgi:hypothetical protein